MRFFKKINRGAIVFAVLLLCLIVTVVVTAASRNIKVNQAEDAICEMFNSAAEIAASSDGDYEKFTSLSEESLSKYFVEDKVNNEILSELYEKDFFKNWNRLYQFGIERDSVDFYKDGRISFVFAVSQNKQIPGEEVYSIEYTAFVIVVRPVDGEWKVEKAGSLSVGSPWEDYTMPKGGL